MLSGIPGSIFIETVREISCLVADRFMRDARDKHEKSSNTGCEGMLS